uniref:rRNA-processing protein FCF1 homolog n=1 Tax=Anopheles atroparvus TaxID=41427 RepID=A0A182JLX5_ANOAO
MGKKAQLKRLQKQRSSVLRRMIKPSDNRLKTADRSQKQKKKNANSDEQKVIERPQGSSAMFFQYNTQLGPPYHILVDTNFVNFSIKNKLDIIKTMMDCLYAKCIPYITDCVVAELEKLGQKYKLALRIIKDPRFERLHCMHRGTYADDCLVQRVSQHKCYIVATNDKDLKRRIRKIPGVPIMNVALNRYVIERMPDAFEPMTKK